MRRPRFILMLAVLTLLSPAGARAAWQTGGNPVGNGTQFTMTAAGPDRVVVVWLRETSPGHKEVRARAWTADGNPATGWPAEGVLVGEIAGWNSEIALTGDGSGGAFVAWFDYPSGRGPVVNGNVCLRHVLESGAPGAQWTAEGVPLFLGAFPVPPALAADGAGGALVGWIDESLGHVQRINGSGATPNGWPAEGLLFPNAFDLGLLMDAERHLFVSMDEFVPGEGPDGLRMLRLDEHGAPDLGWPENHQRLRSGGGIGWQHLLPDGAGGAFSTWGNIAICDGDCPSYSLRFAARFVDGAYDVGWGNRCAYSFVSDPAGGMWIGSGRDGLPTIMRLNPEGTAAPGWAIDGTPVMTETVGEVTVLVADDGEGGAFATWTDKRTGSFQVYASHLDASAHLAPGWPSTGSRVGGPGGYLADIASLAGGVAVAMWTSGPSAFVTALRPGVPGPMAGDGRVEVRVASNPARGPIVALVSPLSVGPARLELVDAAGRLVETRTFDYPEQARGGIRLNEGGTLRSGVYWLRVTQGERVGTKKIAVLE